MYFLPMQAADKDKEGHFLRSALFAPTHPLSRGLVMAFQFNAGFPAKNMERLTITPGNIAMAGLQQPDVIGTQAEGQYYHFDGSTSSIIVNNANGLTSSRYGTILGRIWMGTDAASLCLVGANNATGSPDWKWSFEHGGTVAKGVFIASGAAGYFNTTGTVAAGWHDWAQVFNGDLTGNAARLQCYVDGAAPALTLVGTIPATLNPVTTIYIGRSAGGTYRNAYMSQVLFYNRALPKG